MFNRRGQNIAEYSILISLVIAAAVAMNTYVKRGLQGRVHDAVNHVGAGATVGDTTLTFSGNQYEPYYSEAQASQSQTKNNNEAWGANGNLQRTGIADHAAIAAGSYEKTLAPQND